MMLVEQDVGFEIVPTGGALGAEVIGVDLSAPLGHDLVAGLRQAWLENQVLVFRGQSLSDAQLLTVARAFGEALAMARSVSLTGDPKQYVAKQAEAVNRALDARYPVALPKAS